MSLIGIAEYSAVKRRTYLAVGWREQKRGVHVLVNMRQTHGSQLVRPLT
jgi:hypothetical protein